ncbi:GPI mannosyltransferase 4 [Spea bombifrons]|uniref:GPI mannosyltransferase 4 n=1 Tax=Spea bombifrons TaxID=233779 RepID=UPI00234B0652|nr:GPI mannosyltransferase 4 [Spea bombifrons]
MGAKKLWAALSILRIVWCLVPQSGYLHPDEFFQSPEVMAGDILDLDIDRPWEFLPTNPCRTVVFPLLTSGTAFGIVGLLHQMVFKTTLKSGYILLVAPRLFMTLLSFILDYTVYRIAPIWGSNRWMSMIILAESYVTLIFYTRTISNAIEGILFAVLLLLTSPKQSNTGSKKAGSHHYIGSILMAGFFNRPTFVGFAFIPILYWAGKSNTSQFSCRVCVTNVVKLFSSSIFTSIIFITADTLYYKGHFLFTVQSTETLLDQITQNIVLTPLNFLRYNLNPQNLAQHGSHPLVTHLAVNGIMLFGILHVTVLFSGIKVLKELTLKSFHKNQEDKNQNKQYISQQTGLLLLLYFVPLALLSLFRHQEPRFLIPLLLPLVLLVPRLNKTVNRKRVIVIFNIIGALFFGCVHQAGLIPSLLHIQQMVHSTANTSESLTHYTVLFTHTYMPPKYILCLKKEQKYVNIIDLAGFPEDHLCQKIGEIRRDLSAKNPKLRSHFMIVFPGTIRGAVENCGFFFKDNIAFAPHLSMEDPPEISHIFSGNIMSLLRLHVAEIDVYTPD